MFQVYELSLDAVPVYYGEGTDRYSNSDFGRLDKHLSRIRSAQTARLDQSIPDADMYNHIADEIDRGRVFGSRVVAVFETKGAALDLESKLIQQALDAGIKLYNKMSNGAWIVPRVVEAKPPHEPRGTYSTDRAAYTSDELRAMARAQQRATHCGVGVGLSEEDYRARRRERASLLHARRKCIKTGQPVDKIDAALKAVDDRYGVDSVSFSTKKHTTRARAKLSLDAEREFLAPHVANRTPVSGICADYRRRFGSFTLSSVYAMLKRVRVKNSVSWIRRCQLPCHTQSDQPVVTYVASF